MTEASALPPAAPRPLAYSVLGLAVLVLCWVQFTGAWLWPPVKVVEWGTVLEEHAGKPGGVLLTYPLWLLILTALALAIFKDGMSFVRGFLPFTVLLFIMLTASIFGMSVAASSRLTVLWLLSALAGAAVASLLDRDLLFRGLAVMIVIIMTASLLIYLLLPEYGADRYHTRLVLRGVFQHKNAAGRGAALALMLILVMRRDLSPWLFYGGLTSSLLCLVLSDSKTAWLTAFVAIAFISLVAALRHRVSPALGVLVVAGVAFVGGLVVLSSAALLAEAMGRDLTLTGRTAIWQAYLSEIHHILWLGAGPGNVTNVSAFTMELALKLRAHGSIFSPHSFYIGTLGDIGIGGLAYTLLLFGCLSLWLPLKDRGTFSLGCAAIGASTLIGGIGETLDAAAPGNTWFLLALFWTGYCRQRQAETTPATVDVTAEADKGRLAKESPRAARSVLGAET